MISEALLVIDVQQGLDDPIHGKRSTPEFESNLERLISHWRKEKNLIVHVQHCSVESESLLRRDLPGNAFKKEAQPNSGERVFTKSTASAFVGTDLESFLRSNEISSLVIVGLTTDHCVSASARTASDLGFEVTVVSDATAAHERTAWDGASYSADTIHTLSLVALDGEFCRVCSVNDLLERPTEDNNPRKSAKSEAHGSDIIELRGCYERTSGLFYFARMCSKIRLDAAGNLPSEYREMLGNGFDGRTCRFLSVTYEEVKDQVMKGASDEIALQWCFDHGRRLTDEEILIFNSFMSKRGWRDDETLAFIPEMIREYGLNDDGRVLTDFDLIEMDEGRWQPEMWKEHWKPTAEQDETLKP